MLDSTGEMLDKIRLGEDSLLELKAVSFRGGKITGPSRNELADELAGFANSNEGVLVLGVDDKTKEVSGIPLEKLDQVEAYVREICNDSIVPPLSAKILRLELPDAQGVKRAVIKIEVPRRVFPETWELEAENASGYAGSAFPATESEPHHSFR